MEVEHAYDVLQLQFLSLTHNITLHHHDNRYYMVLDTILLHNMMVESRLNNDEREDGSMYNTISYEVDNENRVLRQDGNSKADDDGSEDNDETIRDSTK